MPHVFNIIDLSLSLCRWHFDVNLYSQSWRHFLVRSIYFWSIVIGMHTFRQAISLFLPLPLLKIHILPAINDTPVISAASIKNWMHFDHCISVWFSWTEVMVWLFLARKLTRCLVEDHPSKCRKKRASLAMDYLFLGLSHFLVANRHSLLVAGSLYQAGLFWKIWRTTWPHK